MMRFLKFTNCSGVYVVPIHATDKQAKDFDDFVNCDRSDLPAVDVLTEDEVAAMQTLELHKWKRHPR
jgi:hypothetical protein